MTQPKVHTIYLWCGITTAYERCSLSINIINYELKKCNIYFNK